MRWYDYIKKMNESKMVKSAFESQLIGYRKGGGVDCLRDRSIV